jgi:hypothetical protein
MNDCLGRQHVFNISSVNVDEMHISVNYIYYYSMTKLLDADWLRGVQLFHKFYCSTINDFPKTNKMAESYFDKIQMEMKLP